jgi:GDP-L-fucose synthase
MKVLITGAGGMVGRNIAEYLKKHTSFNILIPSKEELNLLNEYQVKTYLKKEKPDLIIHAAGVVGGIQANINNPVKFLVENSLIGINLINTSYKLGIKKLLNIASSCMYPKFANNPLKEEYILDGKLEPTNEGYALAKITAAKLCEYIVKENKNFLYKTIIPCNLYGKYDKFDLEYSHMIPAVIMKIHNAKKNNEKEVVIWGDGSARREFMYVEDLADFVLYAVSNFKFMPQNVNVGLGIDYSIKEYYQVIADVIGYKGKFVYDLSKPVGMKQKLVDISKLEKFGWSYKTSLRDGIQKTYEYFLERQKK